jgi:hypothetical protein
VTGCQAPVGEEENTVPQFVHPIALRNDQNPENRMNPKLHRVYISSCPSSHIKNKKQEKQLVKRE